MSQPAAGDGERRARVWRASVSWQLHALYTRAWIGVPLCTHYTPSAPAAVPKRRPLRWPVNAGAEAYNPRNPRHVRTQVPPARLPGRAARTAAARRKPEAEEGIRAARPAADRAEDLQHARLPRSREVRALRRRADRRHRRGARPAQCPRCQADLHSCAQCAHFDAQRHVRVPEADRRPASRPRTRATTARSSSRGRPSSARPSRSTQPTSQSSAKKAFDDLFK